MSFRFSAQTGEILESTCWIDLWYDFAMSYSSRHIQALFRVSGETVRSWSEEFSEYLSASATPGKGKHRVFSNDDLRVLSYVAERKRDGATFDEIHVGLKSGERGDEPVLAPAEVESIVSGDIEKRLATQIEQLHITIERVRQERDDALEKAQEAQQYREKSIQLESDLTNSRSQVDKLEQRLDELQKRVESLSKEAGDAYVRGVMETLERLGGLPKSDRSSDDQ